MSNTPNHTDPTKARAVLLLRTYDTLREILAETERELNATCRDYGKANGYYAGFSKDTLRRQINAEGKTR